MNLKTKRFSEWLELLLLSSYLEIVDSSFDYWSSVDGVIEMTDVDGPNSNTDYGDNLGKYENQLQNNA